eukprot:1470580-Lingulodinium_polyedra.AAC.1
MRRAICRPRGPLGPPRRIRAPSPKRAPLATGRAEDSSSSLQTAVWPLPGQSGGDFHMGEHSAAPDGSRLRVPV